jgi:hypothetical protein
LINLDEAKMKKKGFSAVSPVFRLGLLVVVVIIVILALSGNLFPLVKDFFYFEVPSTGEEPPESFEEVVAANVDAQKIRDAIQRGLDSTKERCFVNYGRLELKLPIKMIYDSANGKIKFQVISEGMFSPVGEDIEAKLCVVYRDAIINLHNNIIAGMKVSEPEYHEFIDSSGKRELAIEENGGKYQILTGDYDDDKNAHFNMKDEKYRYLYKADSGHVCFLTLREDTWGGCSDPDFKGIDDDCFKDWVKDNKLDIC